MVHAISTFTVRDWIAAKVIEDVAVDAEDVIVLKEGDDGFDVLDGRLLWIIRRCRRISPA